MITRMNRLENAARLAMADHRVPALRATPENRQPLISLRTVVLLGVAAAGALALAHSLL